MRIFGYVKVALFTTVNIVLNGATLGRFVWLESREGRLHELCQALPVRPEEVRKASHRARERRADTERWERRGIRLRTLLQRRRRVGGNAGVPR